MADPGAYIGVNADDDDGEGIPDCRDSNGVEKVVEDGTWQSDSEQLDATKQGLVYGLSTPFHPWNTELMGGGDCEIVDSAKIDVRETSSSYSRF